MYLMEVSPNRLRGAMGAVHQLGLTGGILIAQILGLKQFLGKQIFKYFNYLSFDFNNLGTDENWQILFSLNAAFIALGFIAIYLCPESPIYLYVMKGKDEKAIKGFN
jgi:hypothetical protein